MCAVEYYSYDEYCQWEGDWELIKGVPLAMSPAPMINHQVIAANILFELKYSSRECKECLVFGEADWKISDDTVVKPDVVLTCNEPNNNYMTKAPEIIVEVISKSTAKRDEQTKFKLYEEEGVKYYIIVYPDDMKAKVYKLENGAYIKVGDFLNESYKFEESYCQATIDFGAVFDRFRDS
jgi:Uma2 family endonuclease